MAKREEARKLFENSSGETKLKDIAEQLGVPEGTIRGWKNKDKWNGTLQNVPERSREKKRSEDEAAKKIINRLEEAELTEQQRLFCLYYVKNFNATQAALKAGYAPGSAHVSGSQLIRIPKVADEIRRLKGEAREVLFVEAMDVLERYIKIAFSDITDFVEFGQKEVDMIGMFGPVKDEEGNTLKKIVNYVDFKDSSAIDGSLIKEIKQGKEGVAIKLLDPLKAMEKLELYFDLLPDKFKRQIEERKVNIEEDKAKRGQSGDVDTIAALSEAIKKSREMYSGSESS